MKTDGGPAFPVPVMGTGREGMTLRDWFAATIPLEGCDRIRISDVLCQNKDASHSTVEAIVRYEKADAMLAARGEGKA